MMQQQIRGSMAAMQTLGLQDKPQRNEGRLKSLFWPTIENAWDADHLRQQGFWLCFVVAVASFVFLIATHQWLIALLAGAFYLLGACGVREGSLAASAIVLLAYLLGTVAMLFVAPAPGVVVRLIALALLLSNVRASYLASHWISPVEESDKPMRFDESWRDKLADQMPRALWLRLRIPFFVLAVVYCGLSLLGAGYFIALRSGLVKTSAVQQLQPDATSVTVEAPASH